MTTTTFGTLLGVSHAQIVRYEQGRSMPGYVALGRLLELAEGAEKNPILDRLAELLGREKGQLSELAALMELERTGRHFQPLWEAVKGPPRSSPPMDAVAWDRFRKNRPNLAALLDLTDELCSGSHEVDASLVEIFQLWSQANTADPAVAAYFSDAANFLRVALRARSSEEPREIEKGKRSA